MKLLAYLAFVLLFGLPNSSFANLDDVKAIEKIIKICEESVQTKNVDRLMKYYSQDAKFMIAGFPLITGHENIKNAWAYFMTKPNLKFSYTPTDIQVAASGDMAFETGVMEWSSDVDPLMIGKYTVVWKKEHQRWKMVVDISNYDK